MCFLNFGFGGLGGGGCSLAAPAPLGTPLQAADDNITQRMHFAYWITKATDTHSEYVIIIAFAQQQWLRYIYAHSLSRYLQILVNTFFALKMIGLLWRYTQKLMYFSM